jgi:hypothetical protein
MNFDLRFNFEKQSEGLYSPSTNLNFKGRGNSQIDSEIEINTHTTVPNLFFWLVCIKKLAIAKWGFMK